MNEKNYIVTQRKFVRLLTWSFCTKPFLQKLFQGLGTLNGQVGHLISLIGFYLLGYLKNKMYRNNPQTFFELKKDIMDEIRNIQPNICMKVINSMESQAKF